MQEKQGVLLRVYVDEQDKHGGVPLYEWIVQQALDQGLAGATVLRGLEGYGCHHRVSISRQIGRAGHGADSCRITVNRWDPTTGPSSRQASVRRRCGRRLCDCC